MNNHKICFILCTNNSYYEAECISYINSLIVPRDFSIEVLSIKDASSMTSGYNEGMNYSDAKYKVYLHQDVFIVNKNFISDIINIFSNSAIGMIGMVGTVSLPSSCVPWDGERIGKIYTSHVVHSEIFISNSESKYMNSREVDCIDGLLMATQYDIPWREDLFKHWDFYDVSQSFEFKKNNYKVVVPFMNSPWVIHDDGCLSLNMYDQEKEIFISNYRNNTDIS